MRSRGFTCEEAGDCDRLEEAEYDWAELSDSISNRCVVNDSAGESQIGE